MTVKELLSKFVQPDDIAEDLTLDIYVYFYHGNDRYFESIEKAIQEYGDFIVEKWSFIRDRRGHSVDVVIVICIE